MENTKVIDIEGEMEFSQQVEQSDLPVLVDFWAPWCRPCQMMAPILDQLSTLMEGKIRVMKVNTEKQENQNLAMKFNIMSIPNMRLFKDGKIIREFIGAIDLEPLREETEEAIKEI